MNETGSELRGWTRRNFLKAAGIAGCAMLFPWLAYAAESDELNAKADELAASAASKQAEADEMKAKLDSLQTQYNEALERYNTANDAHEAAVAAMDAAQQRIDEAQSLIESTRNQLAKRANSIYREGSMSMIDLEPSNRRNACPRRTSTLPASTREATSLTMASDTLLTCGISMATRRAPASI